MTNSNNYKLKRILNKSTNVPPLHLPIRLNYERMQASGYLYMLLPVMEQAGDGTQNWKKWWNCIRNFSYFTILPHHYHWFWLGFGKKGWCQIKMRWTGSRQVLMGPFVPLGLIFGSLVPAIMGSIAATIAQRSTRVSSLIAVSGCYDIFRWNSWICL